MAANLASSDTFKSEEVRAYFQKHNVDALVEGLLMSAYEDNAADVRDHMRRSLEDQIRSELHFKAIVFDLDGCITKTAAVHSRAWKAMFDAYLKNEAGGDQTEFTSKDYLDFVDGRPRYEGVETFLKSRGLTLEHGDPSDKPDRQPVTYCSLGNRKNDFFVDVLEKEGVETYPSSVRIIQACKSMGIRFGVASSSKNAATVLSAVGLSPLVEERIDGVVSAEIGLKGKPAGDIFVTCCRRMGVEPKDAIVVEDATSGVAAGRHGKVCSAELWLLFTTHFFPTVPTCAWPCTRRQRSRTREAWVCDLASRHTHKCTHTQTLSLCKLAGRMLS